MGNVDSTAPLQLVFDVRTNPGDVYTITVPESIANGTGVYTIGDSDPISASTGIVTSTTDDANHTKTFTYRFDSVASVAVNINFTLHNNYNAQPTPIEGIGTSIKSITWTYAGQQLDPVDFTQVIMPVMNPQAVTRVLPSSSTYKAIYANQDYAYQFSVGETDGIDGSADYATGQVNSAVNYGTTIRVPVPRYFTLDESATAARNGFSDETTITQPGGASSDIVITVPKGSGRQYWQNAEPYYFVGQFKTTPPLAGEKLVANGPAVVTQTIVDPQGQERTLTARAPAWTEYLRSGDGLVPCPSGSSECLVLSINGNNKGEKPPTTFCSTPRARSHAEFPGVQQQLGFELHRRGTHDRRAQRVRRHRTGAAEGHEHPARFDAIPVQHHTARRHDDDRSGQAGRHNHADQGFADAHGQAVPEHARVGRVHRPGGVVHHARQ